MSTGRPGSDTLDEHVVVLVELSLVVGTDAAVVEADLVAGRLACPACEGELRPWGWGRRRPVRERDEQRWLRRRRSRCRSCRATHVLLAVACLWRRRDALEVIGAALLA